MTHKKNFYYIENSLQESENNPISNVNYCCLRDKVVLLSRFDSRQPCERTVDVLDASNISTSNGGGSAFGKDVDHTVEEPLLKSYHQSLSNDPAFINKPQN
jgi:hypothetical protein